MCDAVEGMWFSLTDDERREAVTRIVHRRQRASVREEEAAYTPSSCEPGQRLDLKRGVDTS